MICSISAKDGTLKLLLLLRKIGECLYNSSCKCFVAVPVLLGSQREYQIADSFLLPKQCDASDAEEQPSFHWLL